jgi:hypothetical protein
MACLTGSFALTRERPPIRRPVPLGGKPGGKIVKRRARRVVAVSGRRALQAHLAGQVAASPGSGREPHSVAPAWPPQFAPHQQSDPSPSWTARITGIGDTA